MATSIPSTMRALVIQPGQTVAIQDIPVPTLADNEILVKVVAIAQNATDWKHVYYPGITSGTVLGCDFSGTVVQLGSATTAPVRLGDHVAGFVQGGQWHDRGAFAEYLKTDSDLVWVVPEGSVSHEEAATLTCGLWTAVQSLYHPTRLGLTEPPAKSSSETWIFIYGGSTSAGQFAIQLAHLSGYKVATVASPHNHALLRQLGADVVFDYKSPDVVDQLKAATDDSLHFALDAHSADGSQALSVAALGPGPGKVVVVLPVDENAQKLRDDVIVQLTLLYTALGRPFTVLGNHYPVCPDDRAHLAQFIAKQSAMVQAGIIRPNPVRVWEGGLDAVKEGLVYMKEGKVTGEKIVYRV